MTHLAQHIRTRLRDGRTIVSSTTERRLAMRAIFHLTTNQGLLAVAMADSHLHVLARCSAGGSESSDSPN